MIPPQLYTSTKEKQLWFHSQLVKHNVEFSKAAKVARILALELADEDLTEDEIKLTQEVCKQWLESRKRLERINYLIQELPS
jgi:hypothetical protein